MFQVKPLIKPFFSQPIRKHDVNVINYKRMWPKVELPLKIFLVEKRGFISANVRSPVIQLTFFIGFSSLLVIQTRTRLILSKISVFSGEMECHIEIYL